MNLSIAPNNCFLKDSLWPRRYATKWYKMSKFSTILYCPWFRSSMFQKVLGLNCLEQRIWFGRLTAGQNTPHCWKRLVIQRIALLFRGWQPNFQKLLEIFEVVTSKFSIICPLTSMASKTGRPKILKIVSNQCKSSSIFGRFALIWGNFQNFRSTRFWGHWGQRTFNVEFWGCNLEDF